jgi:hypothetical protein
MTPELRDAAARVRAYLDAWDANSGHKPTIAATSDYYGRKPTALAAADLRLLLAALDPAEQPIHHIPTKAGLNYLNIRRQQHPHGETP